jgi:hypothetical protein
MKRARERKKRLEKPRGHGGRKAVPLFTHAESLFSVHFPDLCKAATNRLDLQYTDDKHAPVQTKAADAASGRQVRKSGAERKSQIAAEKK